MNTLDRDTIRSLLQEAGVYEKFESYDQEVLSSGEIGGLRLARQLSDVTEVSVCAVLDAMGMPRKSSVVVVGGGGRGEVLRRSDIDTVCYVRDEETLRSIAGDYRVGMGNLFDVLRVSGDAAVMIPGDFSARADLFMAATASMDMRLLHGGDILTLDQIRTGVQSKCLPIVTAAGHEHALDGFRYNKNPSGRNEHAVDFDIKNDRGGLRHLQHILWFVAALEDTNLQTLTSELKDESPDVYAALDLLLHIRAWLHLKKDRKDKKKDLLTGDFWGELKKQFGDDIIDRISDARYVIIDYHKTRVLREKKKGIVIGDGTLYGLAGLKVDPSSEESKAGALIHLIINTQRTGYRIDPTQFDTLTHEARGYMTEPHAAWSELLLESGKFSRTLRLLDRLKIADQVFPNFSTLRTATYDADHWHVDTTRLGVTISRLKKFESLTQKEFKDVFEPLSIHEQAGIRIALACKDLPALAGRSQEEYFGELAALHPGAKDAVAVADFLVSRRHMLFQCANIDGWSDEAELRRIANQIATPSLLDALLLYTCCARDYGNMSYYSKHLWDNMFDLCSALKEKIGGGEDAHEKRTFERRLSISPEQCELLDTASSTFLRSRYVFSIEAFRKTMGHLEKVQKIGEPQITVTSNQGNTVRLIISAQYSDALPTLVTGVCLEDGIIIDTAEIHTFSTDKPLAVVFLEGHFTTSMKTPEQITSFLIKLQSHLSERISHGEDTPRDTREILSKAGTSYHLEPAKQSDNYLLFVTAEKDVPGFLDALMRLILESGVSIHSANVYTRPKGPDSPHAIHDNFILGSKNIDKLRERINAS